MLVYCSYRKGSTWDVPLYKELLKGLLKRLENQRLCSIFIVVSVNNTIQMHNPLSTPFLLSTILEHSQIQNRKEKMFIFSLDKLPPYRTSNTVTIDRYLFPTQKEQPKIVYRLGEEFNICLHSELKKLLESAEGRAWHGLPQSQQSPPTPALF